MNLLTNAVKFTPVDGRITISGGSSQTTADSTFSEPGLWIYVRVEDTGRGISPDRIEAVFEPYEQAESGDS